MAGALDEYVREVMDTHVGASADAATLAAAIEAMDEGDAQQYRYRQLQAGMGQVRGTNLDYGQVASLAITTPGASYEVGDKITVSTSTGVGASGRVASVDGGGAILTVTLDIAGQGYDVADTATTIDSVAGNSGVVEATVGINRAKMIEDAFAILIP
jgi:transcription antitermination factor NusG